ncbi:MAG TPA: hypothetical protein DCS93_12940 [Microscillaceae bacterium]|nr:hypothetical protein [Microscillaceae bacterium]
MLRNYIKISFRSLQRNRLSSVINILGLAIGLACALLLYLYIQDEYSFDDYHRDQDQIFRLESSDRGKGNVHFPAFVGPLLKNNYTQVATTARLGYFFGAVSLSVGKKTIEQKKVWYADASLFDILHHQPLVGNLKKALIQPNTMVLTRSLSDKLFGTPKMALGKAIEIANKPYRVTAVIEDTPKNGHLKATAFVSLSSLKTVHPESLSDKNRYTFPTYIKLKKGASPESIQPTLVSLFEGNMDKNYNLNKTIQLQMHLTPIKDIHLFSQIKAGRDYARRGNLNLIYIFTSIAVLIVLIACINYMNLATARSTERAKEVGIRKVVGSHRIHLIQQFFVESLLMASLALVVCLSLIEVFLPSFNQLAQKSLTINYYNPWTLGGLLGGIILVSLLSGIYPALILSTFKPYLVLKGKFSRSRQGNSLRKALVVFQFSISLVMIICTTLVYRQMQFVRQKSLGFDKEQMYVVSLWGLKDGVQHKTLRSEFLNHAGVQRVAFTSEGMQGLNSVMKLMIEQPDGSKKEVEVLNTRITSNFIPNMGVRLLKGRNFGETYEKSAIVNEALVKVQGWKEPLGKIVNGQRVIGVIEDFHNESLHKAVPPMVLFLNEDNNSQYALPYVFLKLHPKNMQRTIAHIKNVWARNNSGGKFDGMFIDQHFAKYYRADQRQGKVFLIFSLLTVFIACLGLFGLATFNAWQRSKEIGIRKVLGASITQILTLLSSNFVRLILIASVIAFPIAYYLMNQWLQNFAYQTTIHWGVFIIAGGLILLITLSIVSIQSLRVARVNPVNVLKEE